MRSSWTREKTAMMAAVVADTGIAEWGRVVGWAAVWVLIDLVMFRVGWVAGWKLPLLFAAAIGAGWLGERFGGPVRDLTSLKAAVLVAVAITVPITGLVGWWNP